MVGKQPQKVPSVVTRVVRMSVASGQVVESNMLLHKYGR